MSQRPYRFHHPVEVRFSDIDVGGHAHHSHALVYFEEARAAYWREVVGREGLDDVDYILAEASARYHARVRWPRTLRVGVRVSRLTRRSFEMEYEVQGEGSAGPLITGSTVQVMYDYDAGATGRVPDDVRAAVVALEGPFGRRGYPQDAPSTRDEGIGRGP